MKASFAVLIALAATTVQPAAAQRPRQEPRPRAHPAPKVDRHPAPPAPVARPRQDRRPEVDHRRDDNRPYVRDRRWYGHARPNDVRFRLDRPFAHGRFVRVGPSYRYRIVRFDRDHRRLWIPGGFYFEIAAWDWDASRDWCWSCDADDFFIYLDPDHAGWYLLYDSRNGAYVHVLYLGS